MVYNLADSFKVESGDIGRYMFEGIEDGDYILRAIPAKTSWAYDFVVPAYHVSDLSWKNALQKNISGNQGKAYQAEIKLPQATTDTGQGSINGVVTEAGPGKKPGPGDPQGGVEILLTDKQGNAVSYDITDNDGKYSFPSLAYGEYTVRVEIPSFEYTNITVNLDPTNKEADSVDFSLDKNNRKVLGGIQHGLSKAADLPSFRVYPNPAKEFVSFELETKRTRDLDFKLVNSAGKKVKEKQIQVNPGTHDYSMKIAGLPEGIYFLSVEGEKGPVYQPEMIIKNME